jgi:hypothetical protein
LLVGTATNAGEFQAGISFVPLLSSSPHLHINYRPAQSHFQFGYKYQRWTDEYTNSLTQLTTTRSIQTRSGPVLIYLTGIETDSSVYYGIELLRWVAREYPVAPGGANANASSNDLYFGAGKTGHLNGHWYYDFGFFLSPTADLRSPSGKNSSSSSSGSFDLQLQLGLFF